MTVIGIDAHKRSHTCVAVNDAGAKVAEKTVASTSAGHAQALRWALTRFGTDLSWGIEDLRSMTGLLERELLAAGQKVVRVPPHVMARNRGSARAWGKSDSLDALAVARAVLREPNLAAAFHDPISWELRLLVDRREDLVEQRVAVTNRLIGQTAPALTGPPETGPSGTDEITAGAVGIPARAARSARRTSTTRTRRYWPLRSRYLRAHRGHRGPGARAGLHTVAAAGMCGTDCSKTDFGNRKHGSLPQRSCLRTLRGRRSGTAIIRHRRGSGARVSLRQPAMQHRHPSHRHRAAAPEGARTGVLLAQAR